MRTENVAIHRTCEWLAAVVLGLTLMLAGCGAPPGGDDPEDSGNSESESDGTGESDDTDGSGESDADGSNGSDGTTDDDPVVYEWGLPSSDTSVGEDHQGAEGSAYQSLQRSCAEAAHFISPDFAPEYGFESPRNVLLFAAGVRLCDGDRDAASALFSQAQALGTGGLTPEAWAFCDLYKAVRSVLEQRAPGEFQCGGGDAPPFTVGDTGLTDDPLALDVDESAPEPPTDEPDTESDLDPDSDPAP